MTQIAASISQQLAEFVVETRFEQLDSRALTQTRRALLDQLGVSLAAGRLGEGCLAFAELVDEQRGHPQSRLLATGHKAVASQAAFANGALSHALDFEDAHEGALVHPNAATIPAALAVAEARGGVNGRELLTAIAVGCEVVCRLGLALRVALDDYGWYPPPILSAFGATAAAARLYQLDSRQVLDAFSLALMQANGSAEIKYSPHNHIRAVRDAFPAQAGVVAAQLAGRGIRGFDQPLEGKAGFFALFARDHYDPKTLVQGLGDSFEITNLSFKAWPSCRGTHAFIEAALQLSRDHSISIGDIEQVRALGHRLNRMLAEPLEAKRHPQTAIDAKFSIPFCVAVALAHNKVELHHFSQSGRNDRVVEALAERVDYQVDEKLEAAEQVTRGGLMIRLKDGRELQTEIHKVYGCPERPLTEAALVNKFTRCCQLALRPVLNVHQLAESILTMESAEDLQRRLFDYL